MESQEQNMVNRLKYVAHPVVHTLTVSYFKYVFHTDLLKKLRIFNYSQNWLKKD